MLKNKIALIFGFLTLLTTICTCPVFCQNTSVVPDPPVGKGIVVLKAARLIDGTGKDEIQNGVVVVTDNMITAVGAAGQVQVPAGATKVIDLGDVTLMPGFIDAHTHVIGRILGDPAGTTAVV